MIIRSLDDAEWNGAVTACGHQTAFHNAGLAKAFTEELGGEVTFFCVEAESRSWLVPVFNGGPWSPDGCFATSSVGYGGPMQRTGSEDAPPYDEARACLRALEGHLGMDFHKGTLYPWTGWTVQPGIGLAEAMIVDMAATSEETFRSILQGNIRTAVRKALKSGLDAKIVEDDDEFDLACQLIEETQRAVGSSYTTPARLIRRIHFGSDVPGELIIVTLEGRPISAGMLLLNPRHSVHWLHGWDRAHAALCGNQLLIWTMITRCLSQGCRRLNLGFSHTVEQKRAKQQWGGALAPVPTLLTANEYERDA